jgi:hypothetical protein
LCCAVWLLAVLGIAVPVSAQDHPEVEKGFLPRGSTQWMMLAAGAEPLPINSRDEGRRFVMPFVTWGRIMSAPHGPGILRGQLEWGFEIMPLMAMHQTQTTYAAGGSPIFFRWRVRERGRVAPYAELNGGAIYSNRPIPENISRFNYTAQAGVGFVLRVMHGRSLVFGYRLHHISNGGTGPFTRSVNSNVLLAGVTF